MNIAVTTVNRKVNFLDITIESLKLGILPDEKINLFVGRNEYDYVEKYKKNESFNVITDLYEREKNLTTTQAASYGYYRALTLSQDPILIVEDDVMLKKDWRSFLDQAIKIIEDDAYIITFVCPFDWCVPNRRLLETDPILQKFQYKADVVQTGAGTKADIIIFTWCNTSAVYYSKGLLQTRLPEFVNRYAIDDKAIYDLAIGYYLFNMNIPIYVVVPDGAVNLGGEPVFSAMQNFSKRGHTNYLDWDWKK